MIEIKDKSKCCGCHACASACPKKCISMVADQEGFLFPKVDIEQCVNCNLCVSVCPILQKEVAAKRKQPRAFLAYNKDKNVQLESSSGGIFTLLAQEIIARGGVVFGAGFNENFEVEHTFVESVDGLARLRGSKYVQSRIGNAYLDAKRFLDQGRQVLFTGTPCQIEGLLHFLRKDYDNLFTQDFICHGVPSPLVWSKYKDAQAKKYGSTISALSFRYKSPDWLNYHMMINFENGQTYLQKHGKDQWFKAFLSNKSLRESCYSCPFKGQARASDITLADYWGANIVNRKAYNKFGTSLVLVQSQKGLQLFDSIKERAVFKPTNLNVANLFNPSMTKAARRPKGREKFMNNIQVLTFDQAIKKG